MPAGDLPNDSTLTQWIRTQVAAASAPLSPLALARRAAQRFGVSRRFVQMSTRALVDTGELEYVQRLGHTFLEFSFQRPVRVSTRVVLVPSEISHDGSAADKVVWLQRGISFGCGTHPTTRLCLRLMDDLFLQGHAACRLTGGRILDIGTGNGVLLIAGLQMGCADGIGLDIDACARTEACENLRINRLSHRAQISGASPEQLRGPFQLVTANLRPPTLNRIRQSMGQIADAETLLVLSGFREEEMRRVRQSYLESGWRCEGEAMEKGWGALVLTRGA